MGVGSGVGWAKGRRSRQRRLDNATGNTVDAEVRRGRVLLFLRGLGASTDVQASARTHSLTHLHTRARARAQRAREREREIDERRADTRVAHLILRGCRASMSLILLRTQ